MTLKDTEDGFSNEADEVLAGLGSRYGGSMAEESRTDSFEALLLELVGELDETHPALTNLGRFDVTGTLGEGGFGAVYAATDTRDGREVALKVLRRGSADALLRFKREFRSLADVRHRNLVQLYELLQVGDKWLLSMERVGGVPFDRYVEAHPDGLRAALGQLVEGVCALHGVGKLHRDLKPSNVLVEDGGRVVILDFGLVLEQSSDGSTVLAGTPAYMSPEQCAQGELGPASDWYAVGVMLYQALSGRLPLEGTMVELLQRKQEQDAPQLEMEGELASLAMRLLARAPTERPTGEELLALVGGGCEQVPATRSPFVGRRSEIQWLEQRLRRRAPQLIVVVGPPGIGKTTLVAEALRVTPEVLTFRGRCHPRESVPFKAFDEVVDAIARFLAKTPQPEVFLPRDAGSLSQVFPVLRDACGSISASGDRGESRRRAFSALRELLARIAERRSVVVAIDDLQWGDRDSATLLVELLHGAGAAPMTVLATLRDDEEGETLAQLRRLGAEGVGIPTEELRLDVLDVDGARTLAAAHLDDETAVDRVVRESSGHPQRLEELARYGGSGDYAAFLRGRFEKAPARGREALRLVAVAGFPVPQPWLLSALALDAVDELQPMFEERLLRRTPRGVLPHHDRVAEVVLADMSDEARGRASLILAEACPEPTVWAERVATLFEDADDPRAASRLLMAGRQAAAQLAFRRASTLLLRARVQRHRHTSTRERDASLEVELASALSLAGSAVDAASAYEQAANQSLAPEEEARLRSLAANELAMTGRLDSALACWQQALGALELRLPQTNAEAGAELARQTVRRWWPRRRRSPSRARARARALYEASWLLQFMRPLVGAALAATLRAEAMDSNDRYPHFLAAGAEALSVAIRRGGAGHAEALDILRRAHRAVAPLGLEGVEQTNRFLEGWVHCYGLDMARARQAFEELMAMPSIRGAWGAEMAVARSGLGTALFSLGDLSLGRFATSLVVEAEERDQLVLRLLGRMYESAFVPGHALPGVAADVDALASEARRRGMEMADLWTRVFAVGTALMSDEAERAYEQSHASVVATHALRFLGTRYHYLEHVSLQSRAALWLAVHRADRRGSLLDEARRHAAMLRAERGGYSQVHGLAIEAGLASFDSGDDRLLRCLHALQEAAQKHGYTSHAALAADALRRRSHDPGRFPDGLTMLREAGVAEPAFFARYYLPGRFHACGPRGGPIA